MLPDIPLQLLARTAPVELGLPSRLLGLILKSSWEIKKWVSPNLLQIRESD